MTEQATEANEARARAELLRFLEWLDGNPVEEDWQGCVDTYLAQHPEAGRAAVPQPPTEATPMATYSKRIYKVPQGEEYTTPVNEERCSNVCNDVIEQLINATAGPLEAFIVAFMALKMLPHVVEGLLKVTPEQTADMVEEAAAIVAHVHASADFTPFSGKGGDG